MAGLINALTGGGGTKSKTSSEVINETAISVVQRSINECKGGVSQAQMIDIQKVKGDIKVSGVGFKQYATIKTDCLMEATKQAEIQQNLANTLAQLAHSEGIAGLSWLGNTQAETSSKIVNKFRADFTQEDINRAISVATQRQGIQIGDVGGDVAVEEIEFEQKSEAVAKAVLQSKSYSQTLNEVSNDIEQAAAAKEKTIFGEIFGGGGFMWLFIIIIIIAIIYGVLKLLFGGGSQQVAMPMIYQEAHPPPYEAPAYEQEYAAAQASQYGPTQLPAQSESPYGQW